MQIEHFDLETLQSRASTMPAMAIGKHVRACKVGDLQDLGKFINFVERIRVAPVRQDGTKLDLLKWQHDVVRTCWQKLRQLQVQHSRDLQLKLVGKKKYGKKEGDYITPHGGNSW